MFPDLNQFSYFLIGMPRGINFQEVMKLIYTIPGIVKVHNLRIWSLSMDKTALSAHIVIGKFVL